MRGYFQLLSREIRLLFLTGQDLLISEERKLTYMIINIFYTYIHKCIHTSRGGYRGGALRLRPIPSQRPTLECTLEVEGWIIFIGYENLAPHLLTNWGWVAENFSRSAPFKNPVSAPAYVRVQTCSAYIYKTFIEISLQYFGEKSIIKVMGLNGTFMIVICYINP